MEDLYQYWMVSIYRHKSLLVRHECVECTYQHYLTHFNGHHLRPLNVEPSILMVFDSGAIMAIVRWWRFWSPDGQMKSSFSWRLVIILNLWYAYNAFKKITSWPTECLVTLKIKSLPPALASFYENRVTYKKDLKNFSIQRATSCQGFYNRSLFHGAISIFIWSKWSSDYGANPG